MSGTAAAVLAALPLSAVVRGDTVRMERLADAFDRAVEIEGPLFDVPPYSAKCVRWQEKRGKDREAAEARCAELRTEAVVASERASIALVASAGFHESGYQGWVERCESRWIRDEKGKTKRSGDDGFSLGVLQELRGGDGTWRGFAKADLCVSPDDDDAAARAKVERQVLIGYRHFVLAKRQCGGGPLAWLRAFARGHCDEESFPSTSSFGIFLRLAKRANVMVYQEADPPHRERARFVVPKLERAKLTAPDPVVGPADGAVREAAR